MRKRLLALAAALFLTACLQGPDTTRRLSDIEADMAAQLESHAQLADSVARQESALSELATREAEQAQALAGLATRGAEEAAVLSELATRSSEQAAAMATQDFLISYLFTRGPLVITPLAPGSTPTPYQPVMGSVLMEEGRCCAEGVAGDEMALSLALSAESPQAAVTEMRIRLARVRLEASQLTDEEWEPFAAEKTIMMRPAVGWVSYVVTVQFRDAQGNVSPPYYDDIAVEGLLK